MRLAVIDGAELRRLLPMADAIDALEEAFSAPELPQAPPRTFLSVAEAELGMMPATGPPGAGVKVLTINEQNPPRGLPLIHAVYVLFAPSTMETRGVIEGEALTALRTAAVSGLATRFLARPEASHLVLFGAGVQAHAHLEAMVATRPLERVTVVSRTHERAERLADVARSMGFEAAVGDPASVAEADIVCTCTTSDSPVFDGGALATGAHVNAVGAYRPDARELDASVIRRAAKVVVETRESARAEAGDIVLAIESGDLSWSTVLELRELVSGRPGRAPGDVTVFKSVGLALEDLVVASAAFARLASEERRV